MKKIIVLMTVVIGVHCVAISALFLVQGCKTTKKPTGDTVSQTPVMPPLSAPSAAPAKVEPLAPLEIKGEETIEYTVKSGDSLGSIAQKHNVSRSELAALNKLTDPNKIRVGQKLIIPKRSHVAVAAPVSKTAKSKTTKEKKSEASPSLAAGINEYVVEAGDSLSKVSAKFKVKISELREVNKLVNDKLKVGQKLIIPGAKKSEGTPEAAPAPAAPETSASPAPVKTETPAVNPPAATGEVSSATAVPAKTSGSGITHVVAPSEDLSSIAKLYAVTVEDIAAANKLGTNRTVQAGQKIIIP